MEFTTYFSSAALGVAVSKLAYRSVRFWWDKKTLKQLYIEEAARVQDTHEAYSIVQNDEDGAPVEDAIAASDPIRARRHKGYFRNFLVQTGHAKFGCPIRNEANRLVVRKFLYDTCRDAGLIARHINEHIDIATELVFVPTKGQLTALAVAHTELSRVRLGVSHDLGGPRATIA